MPKRFSEEERAYIMRRLKEEAAKCMAQYGIRKTTVDEIVRRVKIPKGTFYHFYQSKEMLLFEVILEQHEIVEREVVRGFESLKGRELDVEGVTDVMMGFYRMMDEMPVLKGITSEEVEMLARKLPVDVLEKHLTEDMSMTERILHGIAADKGMDTEALTAAFRAVYFATLHKEEIGSAQSDLALRYLVRGLEMQIL